MIGAIIKAILAALSVWKQERELRNSPQMIAAKVAGEREKVAERLRETDAVLANPNASAEDHAEALKRLRLLHS